MAARPVTDQACERVRDGFLEFLESFRPGGDGAESSIHTDGSEPGSEPAAHYIRELHEMARRGTATLPVDFAHLQAWDGALADLVVAHHLRLDEHLKRALQSAVRAHAEGHLVDDEGNDREFWIALFNLSTVDSLRSLRSAQLGRLVAFQARGPRRGRSQVGVEALRSGCRLLVHGEPVQAGARCAPHLVIYAASNLTAQPGPASCSGAPERTPVRTARRRSSTPPLRAARPAQPSGRSPGAGRPSPRSAPARTAPAAHAPRARPRRAP